MFIGAANSKPVGAAQAVGPDRLTPVLRYWLSLLALIALLALVSGAAVDAVLPSMLCSALCSFQTARLWR